MKFTPQHYVWHDKKSGKNIPGVRITTAGAFFWVPYSAIYKLTDEMVDLVEQYENMNSTKENEA